MRNRISVCLYALMITACTKAPQRLPNSNFVNSSNMPLRCVECSYVEEKGFRRISGKIQNDSRSEVKAVVLNVDFRNSQGGTVAKLGNVSSPKWDTVKPRLSERFNVAVPADQPGVTQAVLYFQNSTTGERLSDPTTLFLIISLDSEHRQ